MSLLLSCVCNEGRLPKKWFPGAFLEEDLQTRSNSFLLFFLTASSSFSSSPSCFCLTDTIFSPIFPSFLLPSYLSFPAFCFLIHFFIHSLNDFSLSIIISSFIGFFHILLLSLSSLILYLLLPLFILLLFLFSFSIIFFE